MEKTRTMGYGCGGVAGAGLGEQQVGESGDTVDC